MNAVDVLAYIAAALLMAMSIPQTIRAYRYGGQGVSSLTWVIIAFAVALWIGYGVAHGVVVLIVANVAGLLGACATLVVLAIGAGRSWYGAVLQVAAFAGFALMVGIWAPLPLVTAGAVILPIASRVPQVIACVRAYFAGLATQVSRTTWLMSMAGQLLWFIYGLAYADGALLVVNSVCVGLTVILLAADIANRGNRDRDRLAGARSPSLQAA